jgi:hypothetical protein
MLSCLFLNLSLLVNVYCESSRWVYYMLEKSREERNRFACAIVPPTKSQKAKVLWKLKLKFYAQKAQDVGWLILELDYGDELISCAGEEGAGAGAGAVAGVVATTSSAAYKF